MMSSSTKSGGSVVLDVDGVTFHCVKDELAKKSPYFEAMFSSDFVEKHKDVIKIQGVDAEAMKFVLKWMNDEAQIDSLRSEEVLVVLQAAAMLQFEHLQLACEEVMVQSWLSPDSCLVTAALADQLSLLKLYRKATSLALWRFSEVRHTQAFLDLPIEALIQYLSNDSLSLGSSDDEFLVFEGVSCWIEYKMAERKKETMKALSCVRMNFVSNTDISSMLNYTCIDSSRSAQLLLHCIISIKEGRTLTIEEESAGSLQFGVQETLEESNSCCKNFKKIIADGLKSCSSGPVIERSPETLCIGMNDDLKNPRLENKVLSFTSEIVSEAKKILGLKKRQLPIVACMIGHMTKAGKNLVSEENCMPSYSHTRKNKRERRKRDTPHIFYWDSNNSVRPMPLLPLLKIDQAPTEALGYTVVSRGQELYLVGGEYVLGYGDWNKTVWRYNVWSESWTFETSLEVPRRHQFVVCLDDDMYVIGGCGRFRVLLNSVDRYNFISKTWHKCAPLPNSMHSAAACVHNNLIYVISCQVLCYNPVNNCWTTITDVHIPLGSSINTAMSYGSYIYLTGVYSQTLMRFDPLDEKSMVSIGMFQNIAGNSCIVDDKIFSFTEQNERPSLEMYDISSSTFKLLWEGTTSECKISFKKFGSCFPLVLYDTLWHSVLQKNDYSCKLKEEENK